MVAGESVMFRRGRRWKRARITEILPGSMVRVGQGIVVGRHLYEMQYTVLLEDLRRVK